MQNVELSADNNPSPTGTSVVQPVATFVPHEDFDITIIWHNIDSRSNFQMFRKESRGPVERILAGLATVLQSGVIDEVISVNASKHLFCITLATEKNKEDGLMEQIFSVQ
ncbi:hypothetical protein HBH98_106430 [Parastagonospora nodorum]|nr:hypothetical protein HBH53_073440 [Parastagonospora nodorum]KAH4024195.1 hypothetical protein HBI13_084190 [Parastagonospora nodorum]KAH4033919.1 hypothetical protein HBI09_114480 [Parastagonospora nodorum]KAH4046471.1 hypothetical protein HBH49_183840 [Parastagonospora nodorum]KAH4061922.1 hypothetical protein HBH50_212060 [Parastagonospora nodorum]